MTRPRRYFIILLTLSAFLVVFFSRQNELLRNFTHSSDMVRTQISQNVQMSSSFVDQMSLLGEDYFLHGTARPSPWRAMILPASSGESFNMDSAKMVDLTDSVGNLTGTGQPYATPAQSENMELALLYNPYFEAFYDSLPGIAWLYYTGAEGFLNIYPWVSSSEYHFALSDLEKPFYQPGTPEQNPNRMRFWTPVYLDSAGKGLMVTVSKPVYKGDTFRGVVSLDFTLKTLSALMDPQYRTLLVNEDSQVLAGTDDPERLTEKITTTADYLGQEIAQDLELITYSRSNTLSTAGKYYVYADGINNAPWTLISMMPLTDVLLNSLLFSSPVLLIGVLLLLSNNAYEHQRDIENRLKSTVEDLEDSRLQLESAASIDFLTGALNRRSMTERLNEEISRSSRYGTRFSLVMGDLDHFKSFNDRYGHAAGDMVLEQVVQVMKTHIRSADLLCRWGGEEFLLMLPDTTCAEAKTAADKLREAIEALTFDWDQLQGLRITMTFGVAEFDPFRGLDHSIIQADDALYHAKQTGRNRVCTFEDML